jgi:hypothetical protein
MHSGYQEPRSFEQRIGTFFSGSDSPPAFKKWNHGEQEPNRGEQEPGFGVSGTNDPQHLFQINILEVKNSP